jgi:malonyl CoA-acyl carrier protein transacylase
MSEILPGPESVAVVDLALESALGGTPDGFWERLESEGVPAALRAAEYGGAAACLEGAAREAAESGAPVIAALARGGGVAMTLRRLAEAERDGSEVYAVIRTDSSEGQLLAGDSAGHLAAAVLSVCYRVKLPGLLHASRLDRAWPWIHPAGRKRSLWIRAEGGSPLAITEPPGEGQPGRPVHNSHGLFLLSAADLAALLRRVDELQHESTATADVARLAVASARDPAREYRLAIAASSSGELQDRLAEARDALRGATGTARLRAGTYYGRGQLAGKVALLFPGQGSQYPGMLRELALYSPPVRSWFDHLDAAYERAGQALPSELWSDGSRVPARLFDLQTGAQLGLVASLAMHELLVNLGVRADCMLGHSNGEHAALHAAGVIHSPDRARISDELCAVGVAARRLPPPAAPEGMMAVSPAPAKMLNRLLEEHAGQLFLAIDNCPSQVLLGGTLAAIGKARQVLRQEAAICAALPFERAHHTPLFANWAGLLHEQYRRLDLWPGKVPVYSTVTAGRFPSGSAAIRDLMADQWQRPVRFREAVERMYSEGVRVFIETGPDGKLCSFAGDTLRGKPHRAIAVSSGSRGDIASLLRGCAEMYACGVSLRVSALDRLLYPAARPQPAPKRANPVREIILAEHRAMQAMAAAADARVQERMGAGSARASAPPSDRLRRVWPLTGTQESLSYGRAVYNRTLDARYDAFLWDHSMGDTQVEGRSVPVLAFTFTAALAAEAAVRFAGGYVTAVSQARAHRWLALDRGPLPLRIEVSRLAWDLSACALGTPIQVHVYDLSEQTPALAFEAVATVDAVRPAPNPLFAEPLGAAPPRRWTAVRFYRDYAFHGPSYQTMRNVRALAGSRIEAELEVRKRPEPDLAEAQIDAALLDSAGQLAAFWLIESGADHPGLFPFALGEVRVGASPPPVGTVVECYGEVERSRFGATRASFDYVLPDGRVLYRVSGLEQKIVQFPEGMAECLFGKSRELSICRRLETPPGMFVSWIDAEHAHFLLSNQGLWARILARVILSAAELVHFQTLPAETRGLWLLGEIARRDAVSALAAARGVAGETAAADATVCARSDFAAAVAVDGLADRLRLAVTPLAARHDYPADDAQVLFEAEAGGYSFVLLRD